MSKAEEFIKAKTRIGSNTTKGWRRNGVSIPSYSLPWLTPDQARKAVEIAREEVYEWLEMNISDYMVEHHLLFPLHTDVEFETDKMVKDLKQAMKDE